MSPSLSRRLKLFRRELCIVNENIRSGSQFAQAFIKFRLPRLVISRVRHDAGGRFDSKSQATLRMIQPVRRDFVLANFERIAAVQFLELSLCAHRGHIHGKIRNRHLRFEHLLQAVAPQKF